MEKKELFLILSSIKGVGTVTINKILSNYLTRNSINNLIESTKLAGDTKKQVEECLSSKEYLSSLLEQLEKKKIEILNVDSLKGDYSLKSITNYPKYLYFKGSLPEGNKYVSVIGARKCSEYGRKTAYNIGKELAKLGYIVVSGMAYGVDSAAHKGALDAGGKTIAVLGSGVDICYPKSNYNLYKEICNKACVISEFSPGTQPTKYTFPLRNRIISGFSKSLIVVEAKEKSGTMITVNYAIEQGRNVFAVPGNITSDLSSGTNKLIKEGAIPYTSVEDVIDRLF